MTLRDYLNIIRERWTIIVSTVIVVTLATLFFSFRQTPIYSATTRLLVKPIAPGTEAGKYVQDREGILGGINTEAEILRSEPVAKRVVERLKLVVPPETLLSQLQVVPSGFTAVLLVTASSIDRVQAKQLADTFAEEYIAHTRDRAKREAQAGASGILEDLRAAQSRLIQVKQQLERTERASTQEILLLVEEQNLVKEISDAQTSYKKITDSADLDRGVGEIIQVAPVPAGATSPNHVRNGILGMLVAIPLAVGLTLLRDSLSDTVKTKEEAENLTGAAALALIPYDPDWREPDDPYLASIEDPSSVFAEAYRTLRVNIEFADRKEKARYVLVTSPGRNEGKTVTSANLGVAFAEAGRRTVLVDSDLRRPRLHEFVDSDREPGLSDVIRGDGRTGGWLRSLSANLWFVPSGSDNGLPDVRLDRRDLDELFGRVTGGPARAGAARRARANGGSAAKTPSRAAAKGTDMVILDAPPILRAAEASSLASVVDGVVLVVHAGITRRTAAARAAEQVRKVGGRVLGLAIVGVAEEDDGREKLGGPVEIASRAWERVVEALRR